MGYIFKLFRQKILWLGLIAMLTVITLLIFAVLGSSVEPTPEDMPVALVVLDRGAEIPGGQMVNFGKTIRENIIKPQPVTEAPPLKWTVLSSEKEALDVLDSEEYYGAIIIPEDLSSKVASLQGPAPVTGEIKMYVNQGMNSTAATLITQMTGKIAENINAGLSNQILQGIKNKGGMVGAEQVSALANPIRLTTITANRVPPRSASGNAPGPLTQLAWMGGMVTTVFIFLARKRTLANRRLDHALNIIAQVIAGAIYAAFASLAAFIWIKGVLDMSISDSAGFCFYFGIICFCFFLIQSCVLNWLGMPGIALFILVFFFGLPILTMPPEMLPSFTRNWIYPWIPMRFGTEIFRDILYFGKGINLDTPMTVLGLTGGVSFILSLLTVLKPHKENTAENNSTSS